MADDDVLLREGLASLLDRSGLEVVGQAGDAHELIELVSKERPELAMVDIRMPPTYSTEGLAAARVIQREFPQTAVVVLSAHVEVEHAMDLLANRHRAGPAGGGGNGGKARAQHHDEAAAAGDRRGSSSSAGGACVPGRSLTEQLLLAAMRAMAPAGRVVE